jgi:hypothetical protein
MTTMEMQEAAVKCLLLSEDKSLHHLATEKLNTHKEVN